MMTQPLVVPVDYDTDDDSVYEETSGEEENQVTWTDKPTKFDRFVFAEDCGPHADVESCDNPMDYFQLFLNEELLNLIAMETNRYGSKKMKERKKDWTDTKPEEIRRFIGICLFGCQNFATIGLQTGFTATLLSQTRWSDLDSKPCTCLHFVDNDNADKANRLYKIQPVLDLLNGTFQKMYRPPKELSIDESMVPYRGRVVFKQFNKSKRYKYGIKLFKLFFYF
ncbi:PiggyBac transposable element-derived protein 4 [Trichostrongylus colubriformis]|uniref:PiggyBac transposable element-derived protein 4 n=1 Tax=Trichostrongylus colubriformis TaxID=6319 RepID=A0AAN8FIT4_TRICO